MNINELKVLVDIAIELGHGQSRVYWEDGRDGESALVPVKARLKGNNEQMDPSVNLIFSYTQG